MRCGRLKFALGQYYHEDPLHPIPPQPLAKDEGDGDGNGANGGNGDSNGADDGVEEGDMVVAHDGPGHVTDSADDRSELASKLATCNIKDAVTSGSAVRTDSNDRDVPVYA
jgi:hypothetical protein